MGSETAVVLDSSFLVAYFNLRDSHHPAAARTMVRLAAGGLGQALLLEYVFLEVVTVLAARAGLDTALAVGDWLLDSRDVSFVPCSDLFVETLTAFRAQSSGSLSFTDAAVVVSARRLAAGRVLTFDSDFRGVEGIFVLPD
jgi:predicted nucleic acid-binding protein